MAERRFTELLGQDAIRFRLRADALDWALPEQLPTARPEDAPHMTRMEDGRPIERSVFLPSYRDDFNPDERSVACYLDGQATIAWWHRNVARSGWGVQGWRRHRVYPDFIFAKMVGGDGGIDMVALETKGAQLAFNLDTEYKRKLLETLNAQYCEDAVRVIGTLGLEQHGQTRLICKLVMFDCWRESLPALVA